MSDIVERVEAALATSGYASAGAKLALIPELLAELKAARAEVADRDEALETVRAALKAERAENERLRNELNQKLIEAHVSGFTAGQRRMP